MKFHPNLVVVLTTVSLATSQSLSLPACADTCLNYDSSGSSSTCNSLDLECVCTDKASLDAGVCCLYESCTDSAREQAEAYAHSICSSAGYAMPTGISCSTISGSSTTAASSTATTDSGQSSSSANDSQTAANSVVDSSSLPTSEDSNSSSNGFTHKKKTNHTLKTGLGVGLGVGIPLIAAALGYLAFLRRRKRQKLTTQPPMTGYQAPPPGYPQHQQPQGYPPNQPHQGYGQNQPQGYPPQGYPPQNYSPQSVTPVKYDPSSSPDGVTSQHEMMGTTPDPRHELHSDARPPNELHTDPRLPSELHSTPRPPNELA
ncbi:hypothetical protein EDB81DRAFT_791862 [Dactylonectria macrodidyma]|uniref:CFEM domain-containing protein n=1 Tax=Dactylonectria macrodidyma TaxID=307937 RepID=A0A9P9EXK7_9HYPO|nr:hypothetical protein EDB81DRAFT_791862 [Dactylonectria macrodidyma]